MIDQVLGNPTAIFCAPIRLEMRLNEGWVPQWQRRETIGVFAGNMKTILGGRSKIFLFLGHSRAVLAACL